MLGLRGADRSRISAFELGKGVPTLDILLGYARFAGVNLEAIVDDELDLPERLPADVDHAEIRRKYSSQRKPKR